MDLSDVPLRIERLIDKPLLASTEAIVPKSSPIKGLGNIYLWYEKIVGSAYKQSPSLSSWSVEFGWIGTTALLLAPRYGSRALPAGGGRVELF